MKPKKVRLICAIVFAALAVGSAYGKDWPMYRYESNRSGVTEQKLQNNLYLQWIIANPVPATAWDKQQEEYCYGGPGERVEQKVSFDIVYEPVVMGTGMYYGSPNTDCVTKVNTRTGAEEWKFYTGGPVRFAPVAKDGKVIFASDDGYLYCVNGADGNLIWKFDAVPTDRKVMGNDRLVSIWPVRGAPAIPTNHRVMNEEYQEYRTFMDFPKYGTIAGENDDVEEKVTDGAMDVTSSDLELGFESDEQIIGLRFTLGSDDWMLPQNAAINEAYVQFEVDETKGGTDDLVLEIVGEKGAAAPFEASNFNISSRTNLTTAKVEWDIPHWTNVGDMGADQRTPNIASIINEIVTSNGYVWGSPVTIIMKVKSGKGIRCAEAGGRPYLILNSDQMVYQGDKTEPDKYTYRTNEDTAIVYFAAGLYSFEGATVYAVDMNTGALKWKNDGSYMFYTENPHGGSQGYSGISPQGYLCTTDDNGLLVPNGRALPALFDRVSGQMKYWRHGGMSKGLGGYHVVSPANSNKFYCRDYGFDLSNGDKADPAPKQYNEWDLQIMADEEVIAVEGIREADFADERDKEFTVTKGTWTAKVDGMPKSLVAADDRLFVSTVKGKIYCFGPTEVASPPTIQPSTAPFNVSASATTTAQSAISSAGYKNGSKGIAVVIGLGDGGLPVALTKQSDLTVIGLDTDAAKIADLRAKYDDAGLYGQKIQVIEGDFASAKLPSYMAQLIVIGDKSATSASDSVLSEEIFRVLRPYGGAAVVSIDASALSKYSNAEVVSGVIKKAGKLPGSDDWTQEYRDAAQTNFSTDSLVKAPLGILWFGGSEDNTNDKILPRHGHGQSPLIVNGRLYIMGRDIIRCVDQYTGRILWEKEIANIGQYSDFSDHQAGHIGIGDYMQVTDDYIYAMGPTNECQYSTEVLVIDPVDGSTVKTFTLPNNVPWGMIKIYGDKLITTTTILEFDERKEGDCYVYLDHGFKVGMGGMKTKNGAFSRQIIVLDRMNGNVQHTFNANHGFHHRTIVAGDDMLFAIDKIEEEALNIAARTGEDIARAASVRAWSLNDGQLKWADSSDVFAQYLAYSEKYDILVQTSRRSRDYLPGEPRPNKMIAYNGTDGNIKWSFSPTLDDDGEIVNEQYYFGGPVMIQDSIIYTQDGYNFGAVELFTGKWAKMNNPLTDIEVDFYTPRHYGCTHAKGATNMITFRSGNAGMYDLENNTGIHNFGGFKSGCTPSLIAAGGLLNSPEFTRTCGCSYQIQTSCALIYTPESEIWVSAEGLAKQFNGGVVKRMGVNFGATGDRMDDDKILWMEYPYGEKAIGYEKYPVPMEISVAGTPSMKYYRHHSLTVSGAGNWIGASGIENPAQINIKMVYDSTNADGETVRVNPPSEKYQLRLYFAETDESVKVGERVFSLYVNGHLVEGDLDILQQAGGHKKVISRVIDNVMVNESINITFLPKKGNPMIAGIRAATMNDISVPVIQTGGDAPMILNWSSMPKGGREYRAFVDGFKASLSAGKK